MGFLLRESGMRICCTRPADNIFLFAESGGALSQMVWEATSAFYTAGLRWKDASLFVMTAGTARDVSMHGDFLADGCTVWKQVTVLEALGVEVTAYASSRHVLLHRLAIGETL